MDAMRTGSGSRRLSTRAIGVLVVVLAIVALYSVYQKERISTALSAGDTVTASFEQVYKLTPYRNDVKLAGVVVGTITSEEYDEETQTSVVSMEVADGVLEKLGTAPSAHIRPTLVLGGKYYVDLVPGGDDGAFDGERIPMERTTIPVELDRVLSSLDKDARAGMQAAIGQFDATLREGGQDALRDLMQSAPDSLRPAGVALGALRGTQPDRDLTAIVTGFESAAEAFTRTDGQVGRITESLRDTASALGESSPELAEATEYGADMLRTTRAGLEDLQPTLQKLTETAPAFRDSAQALEPLFAELDPVLDRTATLVRDTRPLLADLRPTVETLVPAVGQTTEAFADLRGPVLDRINGPIRDTVFSPFSGVAPYENGGANGNVFYKELGFLTSHLVSTFSVWDQNGAAARLTAGVAGNSIGGAAFPPGLEQTAEGLGAQQPPGPQGADPAELPAPPIQDPLVPRSEGAPGLPADSSDDGFLPGVLGQDGGSR